MPISEVYNMDCMEYMKGIPISCIDYKDIEEKFNS